MPKYKEVFWKIIEQINEKEMRQGEKLPSIETLMKQYNAGKNTILTALNELEKQAYIYQVRGSGSFVRKQKHSGYLKITEANGLRNSLREYNLTSKMLELKIVKPNSEVLANLNAEEDEDIYYVKRLRLVDGKPFSIEKSYYLKSVVPYLNQDIVESSIFEYLINDLKLKPGFTDHFLKLGTLNEEDASFLHLKEAEPAILLESIFFLKNGQPFDYSKVIYHQNAQFFIQGYNYFEM